MTPQPMSFTAGRKVELRCYSGGSRPPSRMSWFLDNEVLSNHTDLLSIDGNRTTSILAFWPSRSDHNKYLRCRAENFLLSNSALEDGYRLNITCECRLYSYDVRITLLKIFCQFAPNFPVASIIRCEILFEHLELRFNRSSKC